MLMKRSVETIALVVVAILLGVAGCSTPAAPNRADAGMRDAGIPDGGTPDAGTPDGGTPDAGTPDAGTPDAGTPDAGTPDGGTADAGTPDGGTFDAGPCVEPTVPGAAPGFVAVGPDARVLTSDDDGKTWQEQPRALLEDNLQDDAAAGAAGKDLRGLAYGPIHWVAVGGGSDGRTNYGRLSGSELLQHWYGFLDDFGFLSAVAYGDCRFVAVGYNGRYLSADRSLNHWGDGSQIKPFPFTPSLRAIAYGDGVFVAVGDKGTRAASPEGIHWTVANDGTGLEDLRAIAYGGGRFVAVGQNSLVAVSPDGASWADSHVSGASGDLAAVTFGAGTFIASGSAGTFASTDGAHWTSTSSSHHFSALAFGDGTFVGLTPEGVFYTSPDGTTWTERYTDTAPDPVTTVAFALW